jgi:transcription elongation factor Elf1
MIPVCPTCKSQQHAELRRDPADPKLYSLYCRKCEEGCVRPLFITAEPLLERRRLLCAHAPKCPRCSERLQVQLLDWLTEPAQWRCRTCGHSFTFEPKVGQ